MNNDFATSYAAIIKADKQEDGSLMVYGKATDDSIDMDNQICDATWLDSAMPQWFKTGGNIREQHSNIAAGVAKEYEAKTDGHYITAHVVDPVSVKKVEAGVLKGFSIGIKAPRVVRDTKAANGRIVDGQIIEVSLVDRPANPNAKLIMAKSVEGESSLVQVEELHEYSAPLPSEIAKRQVSAEERQRLADRGAAMPDGSYPIANVADLKNAIQAFGRAKNPTAVKKHIIRRARALNALDVLPDDWNVGKALKALQPDNVKFDQDAFEKARRAVAQLIQVEAGEMGDGADETYSLGQLVEVANHLMAWYAGEQQEGETMSEPIEMSVEADTVKEPDTTAGCDCAGCVKCKTDGGCDSKMCKGCTKSSHMAAEKSETVDKCLDCGCHKPSETHGRTDVSTAQIVTPEQGAGSEKSADADATVEDVVAEEKTEEVAVEATEEVSADDSAEKTLLSDDTVNAIIEKAVSMVTESVKAEVGLAKAALEAAESKAASLETELAQAKSAAIGNGPKRSSIAAGKTQTDNLLVKAAEFNAKAARTTDSVLAKGYRDLANELIAKAATPSAE
jgi:hypothetical protein